MDIINAPPWTPVTPTEVLQQAMLIPANPTTTKKQSTAETQTTTETVQHQAQPAEASTSQQRDTSVDLPMATAPTSPTRRQPLPLPKRQQPDEITQGSEPKQRRTPEQQQPMQRPEEVEPPTTRMRINAIEVTTKRGETITSTSCEDEQEVELERILLEPMVHNTEGLDKKKTIEGMKHEVERQRRQGQSKNSSKRKHWTNRRCRYNPRKHTNILHTSYPSHNGNGQTMGDISVAFLHANAATKDLFMWPPQEFYNDSWQKVSRLHKAMYGLRSSPSAWQNHLAQILQDLNMTRLKSEPNIQDKQWSSIHSCLRWRSTIFWTRQYRQWFCFQQFRNNRC